MRERRGTWIVFACVCEEEKKQAQRIEQMKAIIDVETAGAREEGEGWVRSWLPVYEQQKRGLLE